MNQVNYHKKQQEISEREIELRIREKLKTSTYFNGKHSSI